MGNAAFAGNVPLARTIKDMAAGERLFTVPWAFDPRAGDLDERYTGDIKPFGTAELQVDCIIPGAYRVKLIHGARYEYTLDPAPAPTMDLGAKDP